MEIASPAFANNTEVPRKYTCQGEDISPPLSWSDAPEGTKSLVLISDDPDAPAGTWVHWTVFNIPADKKELKEGEGIPAKKQLADGSRQGMTDSGSVGYHGPCPPPGRYHRYFFKLYSLDTLLSLDAGATKEEIEQAMESHILVKAEILGKFKR
ncbi:MAG: YbhB/YbcL family Raf kinase inhibitor-like protein [Candidatus Omnitrophota bacterium]|nr:YbhB/YbcL family Raf kinase inhibitor-like protein [Candidatus Omnitrophota bacterium]